MAYLYGYFSPDDLEGIKIKQLIPSLQLPVEGKPLEKVTYMYMHTDSKLKQVISFSLKYFGYVFTTLRMVKKRKNYTVHVMEKSCYY